MNGYFSQLFRIALWGLLLMALGWLFLIQRTAYTSGGHPLPIALEVVDATTGKPVGNTELATLWPYDSKLEQFKTVTGTDGKGEIKFYAPGGIYWEQSFLTGKRRWNRSGNVSVKAMLQAKANGYRPYETNLANVFGTQLTWKGTLALKHTVLLQPVATEKTKE